MDRQKVLKHVRVVLRPSREQHIEVGGCGECQTSCQSACKTSCTVGNLICEK